MPTNYFGSLLTQVSCWRNAIDVFYEEFGQTGAPIQNHAKYVVQRVSRLALSFSTYVSEKNDNDFEDGTGRHFLVNSECMNYSESTYEFEKRLDLGRSRIQGRPQGPLPAK
jgi:hypothetical protein